MSTHVPRNILLVEDEPALQRILGGVLSDAGHCVEVVPSAERAIDRLLAGAGIDLVLTDKNLPDADGLELLRTIRTRERDGRLRGHLGVVIATGYPSRDSALQALAHDADDYLVKPFVSLGHAVDAIHAVLEADRGRRHAGARLARRIADGLAGLPGDLADLNVAVVAGEHTTSAERRLRSANARLLPSLSLARADVVVGNRLVDLNAVGARRPELGRVLLDGHAPFRDIVELIRTGGGAVVDPGLLEDGT